ncbi:phage tail assembly protein [Moraxella sp.]|uniref:phage tail assembly protein n=1 Tax=Moraxella sp. TaxID=479 RepID=UPI0026DDB7C4|nr:phage tail assembly protein [Moraxella sp.]MDO4894368.1 phage tail assembly protein [Moraxella sp.]
MSNQNQNTANPAHLVAEQLNTHTMIVLKFPIQNGLGETVSELKMRRAKVGDLRAVGQLKNEMEQELALFARLTGLVPEDLDLLDTADYKQIQDTFRKFSE